MFCVKCGAEQPDGTKFCTVCGQKMEEAPEVKEEKVEAAPEAAAPETAAPEAAAEAADKKAALDPTAIKSALSGKTIKLIAAGVAAVVVIVAVILGAKALFGGNKDNAYIYFTDGEYQMITNLKKEKDTDVEIGDSKAENATSSLVRFSPDGKYVYFFTKYDPETNSGTLCRAEYAKLKAGSDKNDKYIETIASNVNVSIRFVEDKVLYKDTKGSLNCYNGEEEIRIAKDVRSFYTDAEGRLVYLQGEDTKDSTLYGLKLSNLEEEEELADHVAYVRSSADFDNLFYSEWDEDTGYSLCVTGFEKEPEELVEKGQVILTAGDKYYFMGEGEEQLLLYDFVEDSTAAADAKVKEPVKSDFSVPTYSYQRVSGSDLKEADFDELYTTVDYRLTRLSSKSWYSTSYYTMKNAVSRDWGENTEAVQKAVQNFIDKFADKADDDGYIKVTKEVKAALQAIQAAFGEGAEYDWRWMWLCYNKYESGSTTDYDSYYAARDEWYAANNRNELREALKDKENAWEGDVLYCYEKGEVTEVKSGILSWQYLGDSIIFNTVETMTDTVKLEEMDWTYDVFDLLYLDYEDENYVLMPDGALVQMTDDAAEELVELYYDEEGDIRGEIYTSNTAVYVEEHSGALHKATVKDGLVGAFEEILDDAEILRMDGDKFWYASDISEDDDYYYGELYVYEDGKSTQLTKEVMLTGIRIYEDGQIYAYTDYDDGYELGLVDKEGKANRIDKGVTQYVRVDKDTLLYIADEDLHVYDGKESAKARKDVGYIWVRVSEPVERTLSWYDNENYDLD